MNITVTIPDGQAPRLINALCLRYGYQASTYSQDENGVMVETPNPQTKAQFARSSLIKYLKDLVDEVEVEEARKSIVVGAGVNIT